MNGPYDQQAVNKLTNVRVAGQSAVQQISTSQSQQSSTRNNDRQRVQRNDSSSSLSSNSGARNTKNVTTTEGPSNANAVSNGFQVTNNVQQSSGSFSNVGGGQRRQGRYSRQVFRLPDQCAGQVRQVRQRMPTPEPDTVERVYIQRGAQEVIEEITEIPMTPPPRVTERTVVEPAGPPQVIRRVVRVPARSGSVGAFQQQAQVATGGFTGGDLHASSQLLSAGSYGNVQQASAGFSQFASAAPTGFQTGGFTGGYTGGFAGTNAFQGQQGFSYGFGSQQVQPPMGISQAFCFRV